MAKTIALLRGINVGGNRQIAMADLRTLFAEAGCEDVTTYIQSGNVVFTSPGRSSEDLQADLERRIETATGFDVAVLVRTMPEWDAVVRQNPFPDTEPTKLVVSFLQDDPPPGVLDAIDLDRFAPEVCVLRGREIYLYLPDGQGRAKLPQALGRIRTPATARNWRTVLKLHELAAD